MNRSITLSLLSVALGFGVGCATYQSSGPSLQEGVNQMGAYVVGYTGPELEAAVGYRHAALSLGDDWLVIDTSITGVERPSTEFEREKIYIQLPEGQRIPLPGQREISQDWNQLLPKLRRADIAGDPLDYFSGDRRACGQWYFTRPTEGLAFDSLHLNDRQFCRGYLFFKIPGGVQAGRYVLVISGEESEARIPFQLEEKN